MTRYISILLLIFLFNCTSKKSQETTSEEAAAREEAVIKFPGSTFGKSLIYYPSVDGRLSTDERRTIEEVFFSHGNDSAVTFINELFKVKYEGFKTRKYKIVTNIEQETDRLLYHINGFDIFHRSNPDSIILEMTCDSLHQFIIPSLASGDKFSGSLKIEGKTQKFSKKLNANSDRTFEYTKSFALSSFYEDSCQYKVCPIDSMMVAAL